MSDQSQLRVEEPVDILLVEDNPGDVRLVQEAFNATANETRLHVVSTVDDAVDFVHQRGEFESALQPRLVLLDLNLPGGDGCDVLRVIRNTPSIQGLPVCILTSSDDQEDVLRCYEAHANAYLRKPGDVAEFFTIAETVEDFWFKHSLIPPTTA